MSVEKYSGKKQSVRDNYRHCRTRDEKAELARRIGIKEPGSLHKLYNLAAREEESKRKWEEETKRNRREEQRLANEERSAKGMARLRASLGEVEKIDF